MLNLSRFDLNLLVIFEAIYTTSSIPRASERLNLNPSALTQALARLRELLGDKLFIREGHIMVPTPHAQTLIGPIRQALGQIEGSLREVETFDPLTATRPFRVGLRGFVETVTLPPLVQHLQDVAPNIVVTSLRHDRSELEAMLAVGDIDIAIDIHLPKSENLNMTPLWGGYMVVLGRPDHPAFMEDELDIETYLSLDHIAVTGGKGAGVEDMVLHRLGLERRVRVRCQNHATAGQIAASTDMLMTVPISFAETLVRLHDLAMVPAPLDISSVDLYIYWHSHLDKDPANLWLRTQTLMCLETQFPPEDVIPA